MTSDRGPQWYIRVGRGDIAHAYELAVIRGRLGVRQLTSNRKPDSIVRGSRNYRTGHFILQGTLWGLVGSLPVNFLLVNLSQVTGVHSGTLELVEVILLMPMS